MQLVLNIAFALVFVLFGMKLGLVMFGEDLLENGKITQEQFDSIDSGEYLLYLLTRNGDGL